MRSFGSDEHEVSLPLQDFHFIDGPVLHENLNIAQKFSDAISDAGFMPDHEISSEVLVALTLVSGDMKGLVILAHERLVLLRILQVPGLGRSIDLSVPTFVEWSVLCGKGPMLNNQAILKSKDVEEDIAAASSSHTPRLKGRRGTIIYNISVLDFIPMAPHRLCGCDGP